MAIFDKNIDKSVVEKIHKMAMKTLVEKGIKFGNDDACKVFAENGARVEGRIVYIPEEMVDQALSTMPSKFTIKARESKYDVEIANGKPVFCPAYGPVFVSKNDIKTSGKKEDLINFTKLTQTSKTIDMLNPYVITPNDVPDKDLLMHQQATTLKYGTKPTMSITSGYKESKKAIKLIKEVNGRKEGDYVTIGLVSALSPLSYDDAMIGGIYAFAEEKQPIIFGCGALPGATSPVSIMGTMITATAELIAGMVLAQLLSPGLPCVFGNVAASTDMRFVTPAIGTAEAGKIAALSKAMCEYYDIPCRGGGALSDSKNTDYEAGSESTLVMMSTLAAGMDYIIHSVGILDSFNIIGYERFILDEQMIEYVKFLLADVDIDDEVIGYDAITNVAHGGQYLEEGHTFEYMRKELYTPKISTRGYYEIWEKAGKKSILDMANEVIDKRINDYVQPVLSEEKEKAINEYLR